MPDKMSDAEKKALVAEAYARRNGTAKATPAKAAAPAESHPIQDAVDSLVATVKEHLPSLKTPALLDPKVARKPMHGGKSYDDIIDAESGEDPISRGIADGNAANRR